MDNTYSFAFNPHQNGGEAIILFTRFQPGEKFYTQELVLNSYGNQASIHTGPIFTPENLRQLANELESRIVQNTGE